MFNRSKKPPNPVTLVKETGPAVSRATVEAKGGVDLTKRFDKAGVSLSKRGLDGIRAEVVMLLDYSGSMALDYSNGTVQKLVDRVLGFALQIDNDGTVPVIRFDDKVYKAVNVTLANFSTVADQELYKGRMGGTQMAPPLKSVLEMAKKTDKPLFVVIIGDGDPQDQVATTALVKELAAYPVFLKFIAIRPVPYLEQLDTMGDRLIDNADAKFFGDAAGMSDLTFTDGMLDEWDTWITAAQGAGILN